MIKPDIIMVHPSYLDFPISRAILLQFRHLFNKVIICFTNLPTAKELKMDLRGFVKQWGVPKGIYVESEPTGSDDWRHHATTLALEKSTAHWVLFLEQDFVFGSKFIEKLLIPTDFEVVGFKEDRFHPACLLVKREALDKTDKNFAVTKDVGDHFGNLSKQLENVAKCGTFEDINISQKEDSWFHYAGITQNYYLCIKEQYDQLHQPRLFGIYNELAMKAPVMQHSAFLTLATNIQNTLKNRGEIE